MKGFKNLSARNRAQKRGRMEPSPQLTKLTFDTSKPLRRSTDDLVPGPENSQEQSPLFLSQEAGEDLDHAPHAQNGLHTDNRRSLGGMAIPFEEHAIGNKQVDTGKLERFTQDIGLSQRNHNTAATTQDSDVGHQYATAGAAGSVHQHLGSTEGIRLGIDEGKTNRNDVIAMLAIGSPLRDLAPVMYRGLLPPAKNSLLWLQSNPRSLKIGFDTLCKPEVYRDRFVPTEKEFIGSGYIQGFFPAPSKGKPGSIWAVDELHQELTVDGSGAWFHSPPHLSVIVYPTDSTDWRFLSDRIRPVPLEARLQFVIQSSIPKDIILGMDSVTTSRNPGPPPSSLPLVTTTQLSNTSQRTALAANDDTDINDTMLKRFGIDFRALVDHTNNKDDTNDSFFVIYPPDRDAELSFIIRFLNVNGAKKIYTFRDGHHGQDLGRGDPDWSAFSGLLRDRYRGVILAHSSIHEWHHFPKLASLLEKFLNVFNIDLAGSPTMSHPHLVRLFPFGCLILLSDSSILLQPLETARILRWFRCIQLPSKPTWKLFTRPSIKDFVLNAAEARTDETERNDLMLVYQELWYLLHDNETLDDSSNTWVPKESAPLLCPPPSMTSCENFDPICNTTSPSKASIDLPALASNDDFLAEFFAGFAVSHASSFRRFHIIATQDHENGKKQRQSWKNKWQHVEVWRPSEYARHLKIPSDSKLARDSERALERWNAEMDARLKALEAEIRDENGIGYQSVGRRIPESQSRRGSKSYE